jgi:succinate-acetate transporter protein
MAETKSVKRAAEYDEVLANPGGVGLVLLGLTLILFALVSANLLPLPVREFGLLLMVAGGLHLLAGGFELRRQNGFGATACFGYGFFWLSLIALFIYPQLSHGHAPGDSMLACYLIMWAFFTGVLFLGTLRLSRTLRLAFVLLAVYQLSFAAGLAMQIHLLQIIAGYLGGACGLLFLVLAGVKICADRRAQAPIVAVGRKLG